MAIWAMIFMGFAPLGALLASVVATRTGPGLPLAIGGAVCTLAAVRFTRRCARTAAAARGTGSA
jgi:hypothetical protein